MTFSVTPIQALTHFVTQELSSDGFQNDFVLDNNGALKERLDYELKPYEIKLHFGSKPKADKTQRLAILGFLIDYFKRVEEMDKVIESQRKNNIAMHAAANTAFSLMRIKLIDEKSNIQPYRITILFEMLFGIYKKRQEARAALDQTLGQLIEKLSRYTIPDEVQSVEQAQLLFERDFKSIFNTTPVAMCGGEIVLYNLFCRNVWNSKEVQQSNNKFAAFRERVIEFHIGSHWIVQTDPRFGTLFNHLKQILNVQNGVYGCLEERVSTHYGHVGSEIQYHIRGYRFRETLLNNGQFALDGSGNIIPGRYNKAAPNTYATWGQTEKSSDGPDRRSKLVHRGWDVPMYWFLKNVRKLKRCQVAQYVANGIGRGLGDQHAITIHWNLQNF